MVNVVPSGVDSESEEDAPHTPKHSQIFKQYYQFMCVLRLIGSCPLVLLKSNHDLQSQSNPVSFEWKSGVAIYSALLGILRIGFAVVFYHDWGQFMLGRK